MPIEILTQLQYSDDRNGTLRLYVYRLDGRGYEIRQFFARTIRYPDEEISVPAAKLLCDAAVDLGREVRITNGGDLFVFHARDGEVIWPKSGADSFWREVANGHS